MAQRADDAGSRDFTEQQTLWLANALERLPIAIGMIDHEGRYLALSGALRDLFGPIIPSRNPDMNRLWRVEDDNGNSLDPMHWPSERTLRGQALLGGADGVFMPDTNQQRRLRIYSTPFVDASGRSAGLVLMQDVELERQAQEAKFDRLQRRFVDTLVETIRNIDRQAGDDPVAAQAQLVRTMGFVDAPVEQRTDGLSPREEEVLRLMAWGNSRKEIGNQLGIAVKTVEFHRSSAVRKLELKSRVDVVRYAVDRGWFSQAY